MIFAVAVFIGTYIALAAEKIPRYMVALSGALLLLLGRVFTLSEAFQQVNWGTLALILGMYVLVSALSDAGLFNWLALKAVRQLDYSPTKIFLFFPLLAALLSMVLDNITVMLFLTTLTLELCAYIPINPLMLITAEVCAANTGGGATLIGAPPNLILGTTLGYSFTSFLVHMAPSVWICTLVLIGVSYCLHRSHLQSVQVQNRAEMARVNLAHKITNPRLLRVALGAMAIALVLLILHPVFERYGHVPLGVGLAALVPALGLLVFEGLQGRNALRKVDWESLLFFIGLFVVVGGVSKVGALRLLSQAVLLHAHNPVTVIFLFLWFAAIASAFVDNIPMSLSMAYLIKEMAGMPGTPPQNILVWASLIGLLIGGNVTPIGASPNVVAYKIMQTRHVNVSWKGWFQFTALPTAAALLMGTFLIGLKFKAGWY